jgi:F-type H+-transporting ATPase subunit delta
MTETAGGGAARRYAEAAFEVAREQRDVPGWTRELNALQTILDDGDVAGAFANPQLDDGRRVGLAIGLAEGQGLRPETVNFFKLLVLARRTELIDRIRERFAELVAEAEGRIELEVVSARELSAADQEAIRAGLAAKAGRQAEIRIRVDPRILGGLVIRQGDRVTDGSVRRRLSELRDQLVAGSSPSR